MKITQVISDENVGGAGILLSLITEGLCDEFDFEILLPRGSALIPRLPEGIKITPFPMHGGNAPQDILRFYRYLKENPCDILHTHAAFSARLGGALAGIPRLYSTRHCAMDRRNFPPLYQKLYNRVTHLTVATASAAAEELIQEGVCKENIRLIYNGTKEPPRISANERKQVLATLGLSEKHIILGCVARLEKVKGQDILLKAMPQLALRFPAIHLLLIGEGSEKERLRALCTRLKISERVHFIGYTDTPHVYQNLFMLNINPSRGTETSCLATSECAALGVPTVASDFGGNRECVAHEVSGLLFKSEDSESLAATIEKILLDERLLKLLRKGARKRYEAMFALPHMLEGYRKLYNEERKSK